MRITGFSDVSEVLRCGVYILVHRGVVIYVGKSKGMLARVYTHQNLYRSKRRKTHPSWMPIKGIQFDEVHVRPCRVEDLDRLEREYIEAYRPRYNQLLKPEGPPRVLHIKGMEISLGPRPGQEALRRV